MQCQKRFRNLSNLRQHVTFHLEKMFHCLMCGMDHYTKQQVIRHVQCEHHRLKSFSCSQPGCGKRYTENRQLRKHCTRTGHGQSEVRESVLYVSEEDEDSDDFVTDFETAEALHVDPAPLPLHNEPHTDSDVVIIAVEPAAAAPAASAVTVTAAAVPPETDQLAEFLNFQKFLNMMRHCAQCDGYFLSDSLLQAHHLIHSPEPAVPEQIAPEMTAQFEAESGAGAVPAIEYPVAGADEQIPLEVVDVRDIDDNNTAKCFGLHSAPGTGQVSDECKMGGSSFFSANTI